MLFSQWVYYNNYKHGIEPSFLQVFQMISGSVTPSSVELNSESDVKNLMKNLKFTFQLIKFNNNICGNFMSFVFYTFAQQFDKISFIIILIIFPMIILITIWSYYFFNVVFIKFFISLFCADI